VGVEGNNGGSAYQLLLGEGEEGEGEEGGKKGGGKHVVIATGVWFFLGGRGMWGEGGCILMLWFEECVVGFSMIGDRFVLLGIIRRKQNPSGLLLRKGSWRERMNKRGVDRKTKKSKPPNKQNKQSRNTQQQTGPGRAPKKEKMNRNGQTDFFLTLSLSSFDAGRVRIVSICLSVCLSARPQKLIVAI
jgi:hypothetical protein